MTMPSNYKVEDLKKSQKIEDRSGKKEKSKLEDRKVKVGGVKGPSTRRDPHAAEDGGAAAKNTVARNPITGEGYPEGKQKVSSRRRDGNPVLGTGYDIKAQKVSKMPVGGKSTILIT